MTPEAQTILSWQPISTHPQYEVSSKGAVRQGDRLLKQWLNDQGYALVRLSGPRTVARVHCLVADAFIPNPEGKPFINHIDFNRANNCHKNLEWCTQRENLTHSRRAGRYPDNYWKGKRSPNAKLNDDQIAKIKQLRLSGMSHQKIADAVGASKRSVGRIINGETYENL